MHGCIASNFCNGSEFKVSLIGFGNFFFPNWSDSHSAIKFLWDTSDRLFSHVSESSVDIIYSFDGLRHLNNDLDNYLIKLEKLLSNRGTLVFNDLFGVRSFTKLYNS